MEGGERVASTSPLALEQVVGQRLREAHLERGERRHNVPKETIHGSLDGLVAADLAERDGARAVAVRLLDAAGGGGRLARRLGGELLAGRLAAGRLACCLLGACHGCLIEWLGDLFPYGAGSFIVSEVRVRGKALQRRGFLPRFGEEALRCGAMRFAFRLATSSRPRARPLRCPGGGALARAAVARFPRRPPRWRRRRGCVGVYARLIRARRCILRARGHPAPRPDRGVGSFFRTPYSLSSLATRHLVDLSSVLAHL